MTATTSLEPRLNRNQDNDPSDPGLARLSALLAVHNSNSSFVSLSIKPQNSCNPLEDGLGGSLNPFICLTNARCLPLNLLSGLFTITRLFKWDEWSKLVRLGLPDPEAFRLKNWL
jgi:hypothetical protein